MRASGRDRVEYRAPQKSGQSLITWHRLPAGEVHGRGRPCHKSWSLYSGAHYLAFVDIASKADHFDRDNPQRVINRIDDAHVANRQTAAALELSAQRLVVGLAKGIFRQTIKSAIESASRWDVRFW